MRMRVPASLPILLTLALLGSGCSLKSLVNQANDEAEKSADIVCSECSDLFPDALECEDLFGDAVIDDDECTIDALKVDKSASRETLECLIDAQKDYNRCLEDELDCTNPASLDDCQAIIGDALDTCPELPQEVQEALADC